MKTNKIILLCLGVLITAPQFAQNSSPQSKINVFREYDENGNLIAYDSSSVTSWSSSDTIPEFWSYTPSFKDSVESSQQFGFHFPPNNLDEWPKFDFDLDFYNKDSIMKGFNYSFSLTPADSNRTMNPYFDFNGQFPALPRELESYIHDMQLMIDEMLEEHKSLLKEFYYEEHEVLPQNGDNSESHSEEEQKQGTQPSGKPDMQNYSGEVFNI